MRQNGFTLLEVLAVLVVTSIALTLLASGMSRGLTSVRERQAISDLLQNMRQARTLAVVEKRQVLLHFDLHHVCYQLEQKPSRCLGGDTRLTLETATGLSEKGPAIVFYPNGSSSGGNLRLETPLRKVRIDVGWLTGSVTLADLQP